MNYRFLRSAMMACALLGLALQGVRADGPRTELARLVPGGVAVCLVFGDLRNQTVKLKQSGWLKKVRSSPLGQELADALEGAKLGPFGELLEKRLGVTWPQLRDEVLGDAVVLAYQPGPPERPEDEKGLLLLKARNPELLAKILKQLNDVQQKSGELKALQKRQHLGKTYFRRVEGNSEQFYYLEGGLLAFSGHDAMIKGVLERLAQPKAELVPMAEHVRLAGVDKALATLWVNPRALDGELQQKLGGVPATEAHVFKVFLRYWKALEGVSLSLVLEPEVEVRLALQANNQQLPPLAQRVVAKANDPSDLWSRFPKESVLTMAARVDMAALLGVLREWTPPEIEKKLNKLSRNNLAVLMGQQILKQTLPHMGPDCGLCLLPATSKDSVPQLLLAIRINPGKQSMDRKLLQAMQFLVGVAVVEHNRHHKDHIKMHSLQQNNIKVSYLDNPGKFPKGLQPAFTLKDGYLVVASSPEAILRFTTGKVKPPSAVDGTPLLRLSVSQLNRVLKEQRGGVLTLLTEKYGIPPELSGVTLEGLVGGLDLFEEVQLTQHNLGARTLWLVRLRPPTQKRP